MKIRGYIRYVLVFLICVVILAAPPVCSQYSGFALSPPEIILGYGGLFNPYMFLSGRYATATTPLAFLGFGVNGFGSPLLALNQAFNPFFGFGNPLGGLSLLGLNPYNPFSIYTPLSLSTGQGPAAGFVAPSRTAAQTGIWVGTWESTFLAFPILFHTGPMTLDIIEDPLLGAIIGTTILQGSRYADLLIEVNGVIVGDTITLEGFLGTGFDIVLKCILTSPTTITGFYTVLGTNIPILDEGIFSLSLSPAVLL